MKTINDIHRGAWSTLLAVCLSGAPAVAQTLSPSATPASPAHSNLPQDPNSAGNPAPGQAGTVPENPNPANNSSTEAAPAASPQSGTTYDPSAAPLQPVPSKSTDVNTAPGNNAESEQTGSAQPAATGTPAAGTPAQAQKPAEPVGAATAEKGVAVGGAASKPAGTAIAPAKQRQVRSLLIKLGLIAGAGVALGTVYGLSHKTPSTPPGTR
jgi:hypothetical protein